MEQELSEGCCWWHLTLSGPGPLCTPLYREPRVTASHVALWKTLMSPGAESSLPLSLTWPGLLCALSRIRLILFCCCNLRLLPVSLLHHLAEDVASCSPSLGLEEYFLSLALSFLLSLISPLSLQQEEAEVTSDTSNLLLLLRLLLSGHLVYCCFYN